MAKLYIRNSVLESGKPQIAISLIGTTEEELLEECRQVLEMPCDILEWRADYYLKGIHDAGKDTDTAKSYVDIIRILDHIRYMAGDKIIIFTNRRKGQGGVSGMTKEQCDTLRVIVAQSGLADIIDIEMFDEEGKYSESKTRKHIQAIHDLKCKALLTFHNYEFMPDNKSIMNLILRMKDLGADICKISAFAKTRDDADRLLEISKLLTGEGIGPLVMIAMGEEGQASRVASARYGSCMSFAAGVNPSAPGQIDAETFKTLLDQYYSLEG